jgi:hypothetical protein
MGGISFANHIAIRIVRPNLSVSNFTLTVTPGATDAAGAAIFPIAALVR